MERRTLADLERAIRSVSTHFQEDVVVVIGSQAALVGLSWTPDGMRNTKEIDLYLARVKQWEARNPEELEASEEIAGIFGHDSEFHKSFGFYIDGVSINTARLPSGWQERTVFREVKNGSVTVTAVAPSLDDLIVSKLAALRPKDKDYILTCNNTFPLDINLLKDRVRSIEGISDEQQRAIDAFLREIPFQPLKVKQNIDFEIPLHPEGTHKAF